MTRKRLLRLIATFSLVSFCLVASSGQTATAPTGPAERNPLLLISLDGFRWDYCDAHPGASPNLRRLIQNGVSAKGLVPVFPSNTFPNHYTLVTGLYPSEHGMINNSFFDPELGAFFRYLSPVNVSESRWWGGEPIWVTAVKQGRKAATAFWIGSEAEIGGVRPTFWRRYDPKLTFEARLEEIGGWLKLPAAGRPELFVVYLGDTNDAGHNFGPESPEIVEAIQLVDAQVGHLLARFAAQSLTPNVIVVSDHGMVAVDRNRVAILEDYLDRKEVQVEAEGSVVGLRPLTGDVSTLLAAASRIPHAKAYAVADLPPHLKLRDNPRLSPVWVLPEEGAQVATKAAIDRHRTRKTGFLPGDHGYDPALPSMHGVFIAHGPDFNRGVSIPATENIHVYNLLCAALRITAAPNSGDQRLVHAVLRTP